MKRQLVSHSVRLDKTVIKKVKSLAASEERSFNYLINKIVENYIQEYEDAHGQIHIDSE